MKRCICPAIVGVVFVLVLGAEARVRATESTDWSIEASLWPGNLSSVWVVADTLHSSTEDAPQLNATRRIPRFASAGIGSSDLDLRLGEAGLPLMNEVRMANSDFQGAASRLIPGERVSNEADGARWDYLWNSPTCVPVGTIPEPGSASLLIGGAILMWSRRNRQPTA